MGASADCEAFDDCDRLMAAAEVVACDDADELGRVVPARMTALMSPP